MEDKNRTIINWYPGHMAKAIREIKEKINLVDMVIEVCDARAIYSSINPIVKELSSNKFYLKVITKSDLADDVVSKEIEQGLKNDNIDAIIVDLNDKKSIASITKKISEVAKPLALKDMKRGLKPRNVRVMVIGIPNVGKSTLINALTNRKAAPVGNIPGFTRAQKWVKGNGFDMLDTPGILWPNLSDNNAGVKLALIGCIKDDILPTLDLAKILIEFLSLYYPEKLFAKYGIEYTNFDEYIIKFARKYGHLLKDGNEDIIRSSLQLLNDFKNGRTGKISLERWDNNG